MTFFYLDSTYFPLVAQKVKLLMWETWVQSLGQEGLLEKEMATHSSILAWRIPWTEEPGRLQFMGSQRVGHDWATSLLPFTSFLCCGTEHCMVILCHPWQRHEEGYELRVGEKEVSFSADAQGDPKEAVSGIKTHSTLVRPTGLIPNPVCVCVCRLSRFSRGWLFATLWIVAHKAPLSMGFSRQVY